MLPLVAFGALLGQARVQTKQQSLGEWSRPENINGLKWADITAHSSGWGILAMDRSIPRFRECADPPCSSDGLLTCHESGSEVKCRSATDTHGNEDTYDSAADKSDHEHASAMPVEPEEAKRPEVPAASAKKIGVSPDKDPLATQKSNLQNIISPGGCKSRKPATIGGGFVITLKDRPERVETAKKLIADWPEMKLKVMHAITPDEVDMVADTAGEGANLKKAEVACARSHIKAVEKVREAGANGADPDALFFLFEDDVQLASDYPTKIKHVIDTLPCHMDWDIINTWLMPPRRIVASLSAHVGVSDGYWGMQGYVITPRTANRVLACIGKVWAQVDEMIGCCAAAPTLPGNTKKLPATHCVYNTKIPSNIPLDLHPYILQPNMLKHKPFKSTAHLRTGQERYGLPINPISIPASETGYTAEVRDKVREIEDKISQSIH